MSILIRAAAAYLVLVAVTVAVHFHYYSAVSPRRGRPFELLGFP